MNSGWGMVGCCADGNQLPTAGGVSVVYGDPDICAERNDVEKPVAEDRFFTHA